MSEKLMRCKFQIHSAIKLPVHDGSKQMKDGSYEPERTCVQVKMGAVWHSSTENQQKSENAIFGAMTPMGSFEATIHNPALCEKLLASVGRQVYIDFIIAELEPKTD